MSSGRARAEAPGRGELSTCVAFPLGGNEATAAYTVPSAPTEGITYVAAGPTSLGAVSVRVYVTWEEDGVQMDVYFAHSEAPV